MLINEILRCTKKIPTLVEVETEDDLLVVETTLLDLLVVEATVEAEAEVAEEVVGVTGLAVVCV